MKESRFLILGVVAIIAIRLVIILVTPHSVTLNDPRIYEGTGRVVLAGVNPYNFSDKPALRNALRNRMAITSRGVDPFTSTIESWNYYVSSNLPASTAMYAAFELIAQGSPFVWRLLFILGDIGIFLGLYALVRAVRGTVVDPADQIAIAFLSVINPALIVDGCALPEDKQFQTALMLFGAAMLLSPKASSGRLAGTGFVLSLSVLFKLFGIFLFPLWLDRAIKGWPRYAFWTALGGIVPAALSFAAFGPYFIWTMGARAQSNSFEGATHSSPWVLLPWLTGETYVGVKFAVVALCAAGIAMLLIRRKIDLLNFCAGLGVVFACLWLDRAGVNRDNIMMIFAMASFASISLELFFSFSILTALVVGCAYVFGVGLLKLPLEPVDTVLILAFVCAYLSALIGLYFGWSPLALRRLCELVWRQGSRPYARLGH